ncbi:MAG TPA: 2-polyprenylphenol 6-hydroxylase [Phenylobacterium sp.]|nr:2-polyprenylphenol 6-hydroxylase [Phenylobacterium sp.]
MGGWRRLIEAGWRLARNDALLPRELDEFYPPQLQAASRAVRVLAGPQAGQGRPGERLARTLEGLGPVAIKLGQLLSTRADIFGITFAQDLARLKDRLEPFPTEDARREIELTLGVSVESLFTRFGGPVAAASLAQAHDATFKDGRRVAVKVLRPGIAQRVAEDSEAMRLAGRLMEHWAPDARRLEPRALAETVIRATELELDLRLEAAGADELAEVMARDGYMTAPKVIWEGVGKRVLTLEWARGVALSDPAALEQPGIDRQAMADNLIRAFLSQALDHGVFHADLHEGNLFVAAPDRIEAVDFGIIGRLGPAERRYLAEILLGFLERDYDRVARVHFDAGYVPRSHSVAAFAQALRAVGEQVFGRPASEVPMSRVLIQLFEITALFEMKLRPELVLLQKTMMTVEGVARSIMPDHNMWTAADPVVRRWMVRELSPAARARRFADEAMDALRNLARLIETPPAAPVAVVEPAPQLQPAFWFAAGAAVAGAAFLLAALVR